MARGRKSGQAGVSEAVRNAIAAIPADELATAKPARILPAVESGGFELTSSVRSTASRLLAKAKQDAGVAAKASPGAKPRGRRPAAPPPAAAAAPPSNLESNRDLAMRLVEAFGGDFASLRAEINRLEQFVAKLKG